MESPAAKGLGSEHFKAGVVRARDSSIGARMPRQRLLPEQKRGWWGTFLGQSPPSTAAHGCRTLGTARVDGTCLTPHGSTGPAGTQPGWKEEWNGSTVELGKSKGTKMCTLKLFPLHRGTKQGGFPYLGILHQAVFIVQE